MLVAQKKKIVIIPRERSSEASGDAGFSLLPDHLAIEPPGRNRRPWMSM